MKDIPFEESTPAEYGFEQEYFIYPKKKRGRPPMTEEFWYDPDEELGYTFTVGNLQPNDKIHFTLIDAEGNVRKWQ